MKKLITAVSLLILTALSANAMSYEQACREALFLTDKMAYELNLNDMQYQAAYEVNLDYLMSIDSYDDVYGIYWRRRNLDLSYILFNWQYNLYLDALYFYRPLYYNAGYWHFRVYSRYPRRNYYYFEGPRYYTIYQGGHNWENNGGRSWYKNRSFGNGTRHNHIGLRDRFDRGDFGRGYRSTANRSNGSSHFGNGRPSLSRITTGGESRFGNRQSNTTNRSSSSFGGRSGHFGGNNYGNSGNYRSSTRTTVTRPQSTDRGHFGGHFGGRSNSNSNKSNPFVPSNRFTPSRSHSNSPTTAPRNASPSNPSFRNSGSSRGHFGGGHTNSGGSFGGERSNSGGGHFGGHR